MFLPFVRGGPRNAGGGVETIDLYPLQLPLTKGEGIFL